ncbi:hypothetical protein [Parvibaculum sp.]|uniref:hypothetical protein n=1 Tax=Parvibaculum sp. TaxID=2024848 RepID=UPI001D7F0385|nr:hypothetical protein [Parvibaculum sp.]MBX3490681.1 hypothetical protein [Parvibaculum sp.]MCW5728585.1 hypothetical protein [Parvibaculum sp.]
MQNQSVDLPRNDLCYARGAWRAFLRLGAEDRARVRAFADAPGDAREIAPGLMSFRAGEDLRIVFARKSGRTTILALTGGEQAP